MLFLNISSFISTLGFAEFLSNDDDSKLPTQEDLKYAAQALTEIQFVYNLSTSDIYAGNVMGHMGTPLKAQDAYEIALASMKLSHFKQAASWFEIALNNTPEAEMSAKGVKNASYPVADAMAKFGILKYGVSVCYPLPPLWVNSAYWFNSSRCDPMLLTGC